MEHFYRYWGKADKERGGYHLLVYHCLDVAAVVAAWWETSPVVRQIFLSACGGAGINEQQLRALILFFVSLHDIGKFDIRFQLKARDAVQSCWPELDLRNDVDCSESKGYPHGEMGYKQAGVEHRSWFGPESDFGLLRPWFLAVTGHHGELPLFPPPHIDIEPAAMDYVIAHDQEARQQFVAVMQNLFLDPAGVALSSVPEIDNPSFPFLLAGFCSVSDWIGSNAEEGAFSYCPTEVDPHEYFSEQLQHIQKQQLLARFGLVRSARPYTCLQSLLKTDDKPRGVQVLVDDLPTVPGLTLIEAPTGAGKTEVALAYAWRLLDAGLADSIVFALPTQATANAMLTRIEGFAEKLFGEGAANVVLAHGKRDFNHEFQRLVAAGRTTTAQGKDEAAVQCSEWLSQSRKRVFLGQIGVCTVDQVLLSVLPVKHKFVRGYGLNKSVLIVDEVHAYDSYMHGLLAEVVKRQHDTGASAILLSATLPPALRNEIVALWGNGATTANEYPLVTHATAGGVQHFRLLPEYFSEEKTVAVECLSLPGAIPDEGLLGRIIAAAEAGGRVAIIANLVDDAQQIARLLRSPKCNPSGIPVDVFHARYRFLDRRDKEALALAEYGREGERGKGRILVATQVIEQSLDLDFDWMITQICPVDLLFQRLGRLHRHKRPEWQRPPGFQTPRCTVITVENCMYGLLKKIYGDTRVLWRTEQLLKACQYNLLVFPAAYRDWIDRAYGGNDWEEPDSVLGEYYAYSQDQRNKKAEATRLTTISMKELFSDEDARLTSLTRDGEMSLTIVPILAGRRTLDGDKLDERDEKNYAEAINLNSVPVPAGWDKYLRGRQTDNDGRFIIEFAPSENNSWIAQVEGATFRYTKHFGMQKE